MRQNVSSRSITDRKHFAGIKRALVWLTGFLFLFGPVAAVEVQANISADPPDWEEVIRDDHPRLFFNSDTWPMVRDRALNEEREWFDRLLEEVEEFREERTGWDDPDSSPADLEPEDLGFEAARAAFAYRVTDDPAYFQLARRALEASVRFYEMRYEQRRAVAWTSISRIHAVMAWDWLRNEMDRQESDELMGVFARTVYNAIEDIGEIDREHAGSYQAGFYGIRKLEWYVGAAAYGTGIEEPIVEELLENGYDANMQVLQFRSGAAGNDGGSASASLNYAFGLYPVTEQNFLYSWESATGESIAGEWTHPALLTNYLIWNWIEGEDDTPLEYGYGDATHLGNRLPHSRLYTHMANIRHLYSDAEPEAAALAAHIQYNMLPEESREWDDFFFIYPFLLTNLDEEAEPSSPEQLPAARHFVNMGQVFMRSGDGPEDTYAMLAAGSTLISHKQYDDLHFTIYRQGYLALDSGTRYRSQVNAQHLSNYYAQAVAHNVVLVHQPGEPPAWYWGGKLARENHGGQHNRLGSEVMAFESTDDFVYVAADGTEAYLHGDEQLGEKVSRVTRQIVYVLPDWFVIFDRVTSTDPSYRKEWLLHTASEPVVNGDTFMADHRNGRILGRTILPADSEIGKVGGPGREFWANDRNWELDRGSLSEEELETVGWGRLEVSPGAERTDDYFLHLLQVGDRADLEGDDPAALIVDSERIRADGAEGVQFELPDGSRWEITFSTDGDLSGHIRRSGGGLPDIDRPLRDDVQPQSGISAD